MVVGVGAGMGIRTGVGAGIGVRWGVRAGVGGGVGWRKSRIRVGEKP